MRDKSLCLSRFKELLDIISNDSFHAPLSGHSTIDQASMGLVRDACKFRGARFIEEKTITERNAVDNATRLDPTKRPSSRTQIQNTDRGSKLSSAGMDTSGRRPRTKRETHIHSIKISFEGLSTKGSSGGLDDGAIPMRS